jgi:hypothetical protein
VNKGADVKIAFVIYDGMTTLDFVGAYDPILRLRDQDFLPDLEVDICAKTAQVKDNHGLAV